MNTYAIPGLPVYDELEEILRGTAKAFQVSADEIKGKSRKQNIAFARHAFCLAAREKGYTTLKIGAFLGKNHSTVLWSVNVAKTLIKQDYNEFAKRFKKLKKEIEK